MSGDWMTTQVYGEGHLADVLRASLEMSGWRVGEQSPLAFVAQDVEDHESVSQLAAARHAFRDAAARHSYVVVLSQVPPGWTRARCAEVGRTSCRGVYYQVDTIIVSRAVDRAVHPEQFVVGSAAPEEPPPICYQVYLAQYACPVLRMSLESAELAKCAINYVLATQVGVASALFAAAQAVGAEYADVEAAMRGDARIGQHAYLRPGVINQHLARDLRTVGKILAEDA